MCELYNEKCQALFEGTDRSRCHSGPLFTVSQRLDPSLGEWKVCQNHIQPYKEGFSMWDGRPLYIVSGSELAELPQSHCPDATLPVDPLGPV